MGSVCLNVNATRYTAADWSAKMNAKFLLETLAFLRVYPIYSATENAQLNA